MKLELKHVAAYLPYGLTGQDHNGKKMRLTPILLAHIESDRIGFTPYLRPLSDLTKDIDVNGERFVPYEINDVVELMVRDNDMECLCEFEGDISKNTGLPYTIIQLLHEWHFDTFGLIEAGLAIDINTLLIDEGF